jgi:hypothetical protein
MAAVNTFEQLYGIGIVREREDLLRRYPRDDMEWAQQRVAIGARLQGDLQELIQVQGLIHALGLRPLIEEARLATGGDVHDMALWLREVRGFRWSVHAPGRYHARDVDLLL